MEGVVPDSRAQIDLMSTQMESCGNWEEDVLRRNLFAKYCLGKKEPERLGTPRVTPDSLNSIEESQSYSIL